MQSPPPVRAPPGNKGDVLTHQCQGPEEEQQQTVSPSGDGGQGIVALQENESHWDQVGQYKGAGSEHLVAV